MGLCLHTLTGKQLARVLMRARPLYCCDFDGQINQALTNNKWIESYFSWNASSPSVNL